MSSSPGHAQSNYDPFHDRQPCQNNRRLDRDPINPLPPRPPNALQRLLEADHRGPIRDPEVPVERHDSILAIRQERSLNADEGNHARESNEYADEHPRHKECHFRAVVDVLVRTVVAQLSSEGLRERERYHGGDGVAGGAPRGGNHDAKPGHFLGPCNDNAVLPPLSSAYAPH